MKNFFCLEVDVEEKYFLLADSSMSLSFSVIILLQFLLLHFTSEFLAAEKSFVSYSFLKKVVFGVAK
jgi:hypothetical protein